MQTCVTLVVYKYRHMCFWFLNGVSVLCSALLSKDSITFVVDMSFFVCVCGSVYSLFANAMICSRYNALNSDNNGKKKKTCLRNTVLLKKREQREKKNQRFSTFLLSFPIAREAFRSVKQALKQTLSVTYEGVGARVRMLLTSGLLSLLFSSAPPPV
jgi:hypothetical protein